MKPFVMIHTYYTFHHWTSTEAIKLNNISYISSQYLLSNRIREYLRLRMRVRQSHYINTSSPHTSHSNMLYRQLHAKLSPADAGKICDCLCLYSDDLIWFTRNHGNSSITIALVYKSRIMYLRWQYVRKMIASQSNGNLNISKYKAILWGLIGCACVFKRNVLWHLIVSLC